MGWVWLDCQWMLESEHEFAKEWCFDVAGLRLDF
jgi:hypothetical protein